MLGPDQRQHQGRVLTVGLRGCRGGQQFRQGLRTLLLHRLGLNAATGRQGRQLRQSLPALALRCSRVEVFAQAPHPQPLQQRLTALVDPADQLGPGAQQCFVGDLHLIAISALARHQQPRLHKLPHQPEAGRR